MEKKVERLMSAIRSIVDGESGTWQEKKQRFIDALDSSDQGMMCEFMGWFGETDFD